MRYISALPFAALASALVIPQDVFNELEIEDHHEQSLYDNTVSKAEDFFSSLEGSYEDVKEKVEDTWAAYSESSKSALDNAIEYANTAAQDAEENVSEKAGQFQSWFESASDDFYDAFEDGGHHGGHGKRPHHPPHHGKPNLTVYQLIAESKYTTKLAKLVNDYPDLVETLNSTKANYTVFAPTDKAFEKIPDHAPKPTKEQLKAVLSYHIVPDFYPAGRVLASHTAPTLLKSDSLGSDPEAQRIAFKITLRGLTVNFYSRIVAINIFATNGVIHGVDSLILPPPSIIEAIDLFPSSFSTLELGLGKTGLLEKLNSTDHAGGTFFAPSNLAFQKLGPRINAFLFSKYGQKYLKALLEYHVVPDNTLYSDAYYHASSSDEAGPENVPKGYFHIDLPTMLENRKLAVDIARYGGLIQIKVNAFARVSVQDGIAEDGVIHIMDDVIVPPKKVGDDEAVFWDGETEMSVEELKERLEPFVPKLDL